MSLKKLFLLLCLSLLIVSITGCNNGSTEERLDTEPLPAIVTEPAEGSSSPVQQENHNHVHGVDFDAAFAAFDPDTVMFTAGGVAVTWDELFFLIHGNIRTLISGLGYLPDLMGVLPDGYIYAEAIMEFAIESSLMFRTYEYGAEQLGFTMSEEELLMLELEIQSMIGAAGGEENLVEMLWNVSGIQDITLLRRLLFLEHLPGAIFDYLFGAHGEKITDADAALHFAEDNYFMAKHILRMSTEDDGDTPRVELEYVLQQLQAYEGDDFEAFFDALMLEHSEDHGGLAAYPDGYLFQEGNMEESFFDAARALEYGQISDIVETLSGYHIILRIPINYDVAPITSAFLGDSSSLRMIAAFEKFDALAAQWNSALTPVFTEAFETINLVEMFTWHGH
ncbi:MAG: peptidylprolyl isomerase [Oscillospiraceae bacterium]|nr:peptidylprolyl isomerase [Oscillospiraceae bacterium]